MRKLTQNSWQTLFILPTEPNLKLYSKRILKETAKQLETTVDHT